MVLKLQPHAVIAGRITDEDGEPLANVQVQAMTHRYFQNRRQLFPVGGGMTNDLGEYRIFGLAAGKYYLTASHRAQGMMMMGTADRTAGQGSNQFDEGYAPTYYPGTNEGSGAIPVQIAAGKPMSNVDWRLLRTKTLRIRGRVAGAESNPTARRTMLMLVSRGSGGIDMFNRNMTSVQGRDGRFEFRGVTPGTYTVVAQYFDQTERLTGRVPVDVGNSNVDGVEVVLKPGLDVPGTVKVEGNGQVDLTYMNVSLQPKEMMQIGYC